MFGTSILCSMLRVHRLTQINPNYIDSRKRISNATEVGNFPENLRALEKAPSFNTDDILIKLIITITNDHGVANVRRFPNQTDRKVNKCLLVY